MTTHVEDELVRDAGMLAAAAKGAQGEFRTWRTDQLTVVVGRAVDIESEVNISECDRESVPIVRRASGGRSVLIGPGTLQYALTLLHRQADAGLSIQAAKRRCNDLLLAALADPRITAHESGDLVIDGRKVAGLALKRVRDATLIHGTILSTVDLSLISKLLLHPVREPEYRQGRPHGEFLQNLGPIEDLEFERCVRALLDDCH
jgi:lipoate-protein ligase A